MVRSGDKVEWDADQVLISVVTQINWIPNGFLPACSSTPPTILIGWTFFINFKIGFTVSNFEFELVFHFLERLQLQRNFQPDKRSVKF